MGLVIMILTISLIILLLINVISCLYINPLLSLIILFNTVYHYVYDSNKINKYTILCNIKPDCYDQKSQSHSKLLIGTIVQIKPQSQRILRT